MRPLGDGFIKLVKMLIAPIVFTTVVVGIAQMGAMKDVGRIGLRALVYFEVVSLLALVIGLVVVTVLKPGAASASIRQPPTSARSPPTPQRPQHLGTVDFLLERHSGHGRRRVRAGRRPAGPAVLGALRARAAADGRRRADRWSTIDGTGVRRALRRRRHHHAAGADRRVRRDGVHGRPLRRSGRSSRSAS